MALFLFCKSIPKSKSYISCLQSFPYYLIIFFSFQPLPKSVLACIIIVALLPLFKQFFELPNYWRVNKYDFFTWIVAWFCTTVLSITLGLVIGLLFSLLTVVMDAFVAPAYKLESVQADIYRPDGVYASDGKTNDRVKVIRYEAPLFFANLDQFKSKLFEKSGIDLKAAAANKKENGASNGAALQNGAEGEESVRLRMDENSNKGGAGQVLILDCSAISYIDIQSLNGLKQLQGDMKKQNMRYGK